MAGGAGGAAGMAAGGGGDMPRHLLDHYETPPHYVEPLLAAIGPLSGCAVYEPCVGQGHISRHLTGARHLATNDLDPACPASFHLDARTREAWPEPDFGDEDWRVDWTITNPPFSDALPILERALLHSRNVAFLVRLSFLEPTRTREAFWANHPPTGVIVLPRYSFRLNDYGRPQTDSVTCCWILYQEGRTPCVQFSRLRR